MKDKTRYFKRFLSLLLVMILSITVVIEPVAAASNQNVTIEEAGTAGAAKLSKKTLELNVGQNYKLTMSGIQGSPAWTSSSEKIATVDAKGNVYGKKAGKAVITAIAGGKSYKCNVTVKSRGVNMTSLVLTKGKSKTLKLNGDTIKTVQSSNEKVAVIKNDGKVIAKGVGTATLTLKSTSNKKYIVKIHVDPDTVYVNTAQEYTLKLSGVKGTVAWTAMNSDIASVSKKGVVYGKKAGTFTAKAKVNGTTYKVKVVVRNLGIKQSSYILRPKQTRTIKLSGEKIASVNSMDPSVATIDKKGNIKAVGAGDTTLTIISTLKKKYVLNITVQDVISARSKILAIGDSFILSLNGTKIKSIESTKPAVASVDKNGKVTGEKRGIATIRVTAANGKRYSCRITVQSPVLEETAVTLSVGDTKTLVLKRNSQKETWTSENKSIVSVNPVGKLTAKKPGTTFVKVKVDSGKTFICEVTVNEKVVSETGIPVLNYTDLMMYPSQKRILYVNGYEGKINWKSSDDSVVTVDNKGVIAAVAEGKAVITSKLANGEVLSCDIEVVAEMVQVSFVSNVPETRMPKDGEVYLGTQIGSLSKPTKNEYTFVNWFYDAELTQPADDSDILMEDTVLYAMMVPVDPARQEGEYVSSLGVTDPDFAFIISTIGPEGQNVVLEENETEEEYLRKCLKLVNQSFNEELPLKITALDNHMFRVEPEDGFDKGSNYELTNDGAYIVYEGEIKPKYVKIYYASLYKEEGVNVQIDDQIVYLKKDELSDVGALAAMLEVDPLTGESQKSTETGSFSYAGGKEIEVGSTVCIYTDEIPTDGAEALFTESEVSYVNITGVSGNTYQYQVAEYQDVIFIPDTIPVDTTEDLIPNDGENRISLWQSDFTFEAGSVTPYTIDGQRLSYADLNLNTDTMIEVGDHLTLFASEEGNVSSAAPVTYAEITAVEYGILDQKKTITLEYTEISLSDMKESAGAYGSTPVEIEESYMEEHKEEIYAELVRQIEDSDFMEENRDALILSALQTEEATAILAEHDTSFTEMPVFNHEGELINGDILDIQKLSTSGVASFAAESDSRWEVKYLDPDYEITTDLEHFAGESGFRLYLKIKTQIELKLHSNDGTDLKLVFEVEVALEQEVMLGLGFDGSIYWKKVLFVPIPVDYKVDVTIKTGTYTSFDVQATISTNMEEGYKADTESDKLNELLNSAGKAIKDLKDAMDAMEFYSEEGDPYDTLNGSLDDVLDEIPKKTDAEFDFGEIVDFNKIMGAEEDPMNDDNHLKDLDKLLTPTELEVTYKDTLDKAGDAWMDIFKEEIVSKKFRILYGIICIKFEFGAVFKMTGVISVGLSFTAEEAKEYTITVKLLSFSASSSSRVIKEDTWSLSLYAVGIFGARTGAYLEVAVGLFDTDLNSVGVTLELGVEVMLYMYGAVYAEKGKNTIWLGNMYLPFAFYVEATLQAQLCKGQLSKEFQLFSGKWTFLKFGSKYSVRGFYDDEMLSIDAEAGDRIVLPEDMRICVAMDMEEGDLAAFRLPYDYFKITMLEKHVVAGRDSALAAAELTDDYLLVITDDETPAYYFDIKFSLIKGFHGNETHERVLRVNVTNVTNTRLLSYEGFEPVKYPCGEVINYELTPEGKEFPEDVTAGYQNLVWEYKRLSARLNKDADGNYIMPDSAVAFTWKGDAIPRPVKVNWYLYNDLKGEYELKKQNTLTPGPASDETTTIDTSTFLGMHWNEFWKNYQPEEFGVREGTIEKVEFVSYKENRTITATDDREQKVVMDRGGRDVLNIYGTKEKIYTRYEMYDASTEESLNASVTMWGYKGDPNMIPDFDNNGSDYLPAGVSFDHWGDSRPGNVVPDEDETYRIYVNLAPAEYTAYVYKVGSVYAFDSDGNRTKIDLAADTLPALYRHSETDVVEVKGIAVPFSAMTQAQIAENTGIASKNLKYLAGLVKYDTELFSETYRVLGAVPYIYRGSVVMADQKPLNIQAEDLGDQNHRFVIDGIAGSVDCGSDYAHNDIVLFEDDIRAPLNGLEAADYTGTSWYVTDGVNYGTKERRNDFHKVTDYLASAGMLDYGEAGNQSLAAGGTFRIYTTANPKEADFYVVNVVEDSRTAELTTENPRAQATRVKSGEVYHYADYLTPLYAETLADQYYIPEKEDDFTFGAVSNNTMTIHYYRNSHSFTLQTEDGQYHTSAAVNNGDVIEFSDILSNYFYKDKFKKPGLGIVAWTNGTNTYPEDEPVIASRELFLEGSTFTPVYGERPIRVTFDAGEGVYKDEEGNVQSKLILNHVYGRTNTYFPEVQGYTLEREGYQFDCYLDENGQQVDKNKRRIGANEIDSDITYTVKWNGPFYQIHMNNVDGNDSISVKAGDLVNWDTLAARDGKELIGWSRTENGEVDPELKGEKAYDFADDITVYAVWQSRKYTVTMYANTNSEDILDTFTFEEDDLPLTPPVPTKPYYTFTRWRGDWNSNQGGWNYVTELTEAKDISLYAEWTEKVVQIHYELNGGAFGADVDPADTMRATSWVFLPDETEVSREGCTFGGWYMNEDFTGNSYSIASRYDGDEMTFYAKWEFNTNIPYKVSYYTYEPEKQDYVQYGETETYYGDAFAEVELASLEKDIENASLNLVKVNGEETSDRTVNISADGSLEIAYYYMPERYTLTFMTSEEIVFKSQKYYANETIDTTQTPTREGYLFTGWFLDTEGKEALTQTTMGTKNLTVYAGWSKNIYTIQYNLGEGCENVSDFPQSYSVDSESITLPTPVKAGYRFLMWKDTEGTTSMSVTIPTGSTGNKSYEALYELQSYQITYELDEGTNAGENPSTYNINDNIILKDPVKEGYVFLGWFEENTQITEINNGTGDRTLTAKWIPAQNTPYVVRTYIRTGDTAEFEQAGDDLNKYGVTDEEITIESLIEGTGDLAAENFLYAKASSDTSAELKAEDKVVILADGSLVISLYYQRPEEKMIKVTYMDGTTILNEEEYVKGTAIIDITDAFGPEEYTYAYIPTKKGHEFAFFTYTEDGWPPITENLTATEDITLYANWNVTGNVEYDMNGIPVSMGFAPIYLDAGDRFPADYVIPQPMANGYLFKEWMEKVLVDDGDGNQTEVMRPFDFAEFVMPSDLDKLVLYAAWEVDPNASESGSGESIGESGGEFAGEFGMISAGENSGMSSESFGDDDFLPDGALSNEILTVNGMETGDFLNQ